MLTLSEALRTKQLDAFVRQEEARGVGPIDRAAFDALTEALIKAPQSDPMQPMSHIFILASRG